MSNNIKELVSMIDSYFILSQQDIKYIHKTESVYNVKELVEYLLSHLIDVIDLNVLTEERLDEILFSSNCIMNHLYNLTIEEEMTAIYNLIMMKLNSVKEFCVNEEYYEIAENIKNFQNLFVKNYYRLSNE